ncbi:MAG: hypothetical protein QM715_12245 [Nibricoccus sp.]
MADIKFLMHRHRFFRALGLTLALAALLLGACKEKPASPPEKAGRLFHAAATETSGLAPSRRTPELLWIHNDSKGQPVLYAIGTDGRLRGTLRVEGVKNIDWEDIASFELDGQSWLLIADTGDNNGKRKDCSLLVVAEPDPSQLSTTQELTTKVAWRTPVAYPDAAHDCEAVAVDAREEKVYLFTKRTTPPVVYSLPLRKPVSGAVAPAELVARLAHVPQPNSRQKVLPMPSGRFRAFVTGADFAGDLSAATVLTYGDVLLFPRRPGESWAVALSRPPLVLDPHGLPQAEAICFSKDSRAIYVTGERKDPALLRYSLRDRRPE